MRRIFPVILLLLFFSCQTKKQNEEKKTASQQTQSNKTTEFEFTEEMHNFGSLQSGEVAICTFEFQNTGNESLIVESAETDCGCVTAVFSSNPVLPGETGTIEVEFDSSGLVGKQLKTIEIHANTKKTKQLVIFAEVENEQIEITY